MSFALIVGLGNPGAGYVRTRHNVGFMLLDRWAARESVAFQSAPRWQSHVAKVNGFLLQKPQTFMNLSGRAIHQLLAYHQWTPAQMLVVYDDVSLPLGALRFREKGSAGGHNGIKSIIASLGTDEFPRLKIGIGKNLVGELSDHVLGDFFAEEWPLLENALATSLESVQFASSHGIAAAANRYHAKPTNHIPHDDS